MRWLFRRVARCPLTLSIITLSLVVHAVEGPSVDPERFVSLIDLLRGIYRHGSDMHLAANVVLLGLGGLLAEPEIGSLRLGVVAVVAAVCGTLVEANMSGGGFIGLSGVAYAFGCAGLLLNSPHKAILSLAVCLGLALEAWLLPSQAALYTHIVGAACGVAAAWIWRGRGQDGSRGDM